MVQEFRFNHTQVGLTYSQALGLCKDDIATFFNNWKLNIKEDIISIDRYIIAEEHHQPKEGDEIGGVHFHCYIHLTKKLRTRNCRIFDIEDAMGGYYHPHIDKIRGFKNMVTYITKEDKDPLANFDYKSGSKEEVDWDDVYGREYKSAKDFLDYFNCNYPKYFTGHYLNLKALAYDRYESAIKEYIPKHSVFPNLPLACKSWVDVYLHGDFERPLSLILIGESRTGKTEWARSLGRHMYFNGYFNLDLWDEEAEYAVFDDFDIDGKKLEEYFRSWKCWFGAQKEFNITDKYKRKMNVRWGKPIIFISNNEIECSSKTLDYIRKNSIRVNVYSEFY